MQSAFRTLLLVPLSCAALYACSDDHDHETEAPPLAGYEDVLYEGAVTDEALAPLVSKLEQGAPVDEPAKAPTLDAPSAGELAKSPIPTFAWHVGATASHRSTPGERWSSERRGELGLSSPALRLGLPREEVSFFGPLAELLGPIRRAEAHGTPFSGTATWVVFSTAANPKLHRVFTSDLGHTPSQVVWDAMIAAKSPITIALVGALFEDNRLAEGGGPFKGSTTTFSIAP